MRFLVAVIASLAFAQCAFGAEKGLKIDELLVDSPATRAFEATINNTLECVRDLLLNGDEEMGLPSFNPLVLEGVTLNLDNLGNANLSGQLSLNNFVIDGIPKWAVTHLKGSVTIIPVGFKLEMTMKWPGGNVAGDYNGDVNIFGHNLRGAGNVEGSLINFIVEVKLHGTLSRIGLRSLSIKPSLEKLNLEMTELYVDDEEISGNISEFVAGISAWVNENQSKIDTTLSKIIMDLINNSQGGEGGEGGEEGETSIIGQIISRCLSTRQ